MMLLAVLLVAVGGSAIRHRLRDAPKEGPKAPNNDQKKGNILPYGVYMTSNQVRHNQNDITRFQTWQGDTKGNDMPSMNDPSKFPVVSKQPGLAFNNALLVQENPYNWTRINNRTKDDKMYLDQRPDPEQEWANKVMTRKKNESTVQQFSNMVMMPKHNLPKETVSNWPIDLQYMNSFPSDDFYSSFPNWTPFIVQDIYKEFNDVDYLYKLTAKYPKKKKVTQEKEDDITLKQMQINVKQEKDVFQKDVM